MPSSEKHPSRVPMWRGAKAAYTVIAACIFPLAIGGFWAYGQRVLSIIFTFTSFQISFGVGGFLLLLLLNLKKADLVLVFRYQKMVVCNLPSMHTEGETPHSLSWDSLVYLS